MPSKASTGSKIFLGLSIIWTTGMISWVHWDNIEEKKRMHMGIDLYEKQKEIDLANQKQNEEKKQVDLSNRT